MVCDGEGGGVYELLRNAITWVLHSEVYATAVADDEEGSGGGGVECWGVGGRGGGASQKRVWSRSFGRRLPARPPARPSMLSKIKPRLSAQENQVGMSNSSFFLAPFTPYGLPISGSTT